MLFRPEESGEEELRGCGVAANARTGVCLERAARLRQFRGAVVLLYFRTGRLAGWPLLGDDRVRGERGGETEERAGRIGGGEARKKREQGDVEDSGSAERRQGGLLDARKWRPAGGLIKSLSFSLPCREAALE